MGLWHSWNLCLASKVSSCFPSAWTSSAVDQKTLFDCGLTKQTISSSNWFLYLTAQDCFWRSTGCCAPKCCYPCDLKSLTARPMNMSTKPSLESTLNFEIYTAVSSPFSSSSDWNTQHTTCPSFQNTTSHDLPRSSLSTSSAPAAELWIFKMADFRPKDYGTTAPTST